MVDVVELTAEGLLALPKEIASRFKPADRFILWSEGDTFHFKRISPPRVTQVVAAAPETAPPPSLEEINEIVHEVRQKHRTG
jgi:hypothetical protein